MTWHDECQKKFKLNEYVFDVDEFLFFQKKASNDYSFIEKLETDDEIKMGFDACSIFIMNGHMAKQLKEETIDYLDELGPGGFFEEDLLQFVKFTEAINNLMEKIEQRQELKLMF